MKKKLLLASFAITSALLPLAAGAQQTGGGGLGGGLFQETRSFGLRVTDLINGTIVPVLFALIFVYFGIGLFTTLVKGKGDSAARTTGINQIINALIAAVALVTFWGLVQFFAQGLGVGTGTIVVPKVPAAQ